ncbi:MAG: MFS transporter [Clostridia bacterium]|nr:MFS transporter [Clostridia bacterium]
MNTNETRAKRRALDDVTKNKIRSVIAYTARIVGLMCASGTLIQTFLATLGFDSSLIYIHTSLLQAASVLTIVICSGWANNGSPIKRSALTMLPTGLMFLLYIPIAISRSASITAYLLLAAIGVAQQIGVGLYTVCEYKTPYYIYRIEEYGTVIAICGIVSSLASLGAGALVSWLSTKFTFIDVMTVSFALAALCLFITFLTTVTQKNLREEQDKLNEDAPKPKTSLVALLRYPIFSHLIPANLMRGFATGVTTVFATMALDLGYTETLTSAMVSSFSFASLAACALFALISKKIPNGITTLAGSIILAASPFLLIKGEVLFLVISTVILFGRTLIEYAVPTLLIRLVPVEIAGSFNAWRMVLHNAGSLIATTIAAWLPIPVLLVLAAVFQLLSGISFLIAERRLRAN